MGELTEEAALIEGLRCFSNISLCAHGCAHPVELRRQTRIYMSNLMLEIEASDRYSRGALASEVV